MDPKSVFSSKTIWWNLIKVAAAIFAMINPEMAAALLPAEMQEAYADAAVQIAAGVLAASSVVDTALRAITKAPISVKPTSSGSGGIPSIAILLALLVPLGGCEFLRGLNTPENRQAGVEAAVAAIEALNADGFDPIQLDDTERALAVTACRVLAAYLPTLEDDLDRRVELVALGMDVCGVLGVALAPAAPVEAPEPIPVPEVAS